MILHGHFKAVTVILYVVLSVHGYVKEMTVMLYTCVCDCAMCMDTSKSDSYFARVFNCKWILQISDATFYVCVIVQG